MQQTTHSHPHAGPTRGDVAAVVLLLILGAVVALAAHAALFPAPLGGAGVLALALGVLGVAAGAVVEGRCTVSNKSKRDRERRFIDGSVVEVERRPVIGMRCERCGRKFRGRGPWNGTFRSGVLVGVLCPACQTPEENVEAEIHAATLDYVKGPGGMLVTRPKIYEGEEG